MDTKPVTEMGDFKLLRRGTLTSSVSEQDAVDTNFHIDQVIEYFSMEMEIMESRLYCHN